jgi:hypothetical protein
MGLLYNSVVLQTKVLWILLVAAALGESWLGARVGRSKLGRPLTGDQRARVAIAYTVATAVLVAPFLLYRVPLPIAARIEGLGTGALVATGGVFVLALAALALLRFLLLSLLSPRK